MRQNTVAAVKGGVGSVGGVAGSILGRAVFIKFLGKQYLRSPSLSTYGFCVDWKQPKHVRKNMFSLSLKNCFWAKPKFCSRYWGKL